MRDPSERPERPLRSAGRHVSGVVRARQGAGTGRGTPEPGLAGREACRPTRVRVGAPQSYWWHCKHRGREDWSRKRRKSPQVTVSTVDVHLNAQHQ